MSLQCTDSYDGVVVAMQELRQTVEDTRASKLSAFTEREALFTAQINLAKKVHSVWFSLCILEQNALMWH